MLKEYKYAGRNKKNVYLMKKSKIILQLYCSQAYIFHVQRTEANEVKKEFLELTCDTSQDNQRTYPFSMGGNYL